MISRGTLSRASHLALLSVNDQVQEGLHCPGPHRGEVCLDGGFCSQMTAYGCTNVCLQSLSLKKRSGRPATSSVSEISTLGDLVDASTPSYEFGAGKESNDFTPSSEDRHGRAGLAVLQVTTLQ